MNKGQLMSKQSFDKSKQLRLRGTRIRVFYEPYHKLKKPVEVWRVESSRYHRGWVGIYLFGWNITIGDF